MLDSLTNVLASFLVILIGILTYYKWAFQYWKNRNIYVPKATIPFGTLNNPFSWKLHSSIQVKNIYDAARSEKLKHIGLYNFTAPFYMPIDPKFIKHVLQQQNFMDHGVYYNEKDDPLTANLFTLNGDRWRILRTKLSPAFTPGKIKIMSNIIANCGYQMQKALMSYCENGQPIDIKDVSSRYTVDVIGSTAFGIECNGFTNPEAEFIKYAKTIFEPMSPLRVLTFHMGCCFPNFSRFLGIRVFKKETTDFFMKIVEDTVKFRETNNFVRNDLLQLLIDLRKQLEEQNENFTISELAAQVFAFFGAGYESSSSSMAFCLYELATHPEIQDKVRLEIKTVLEKYDDKLSVEAIGDMQYMNQVIDETLRKHPPISFIPRRCMNDYKIPDTDLIIEKGVYAIISVLGLHRDPAYFPDPERFDPERFSPDNKQEIVPFTYIPFGEGPRICIGLRLGQLQTKIGLAILLKHYKFTLNEKTELPIKMDPYCFALIPEKGIFLNIDAVKT